MAATGSNLSVEMQERMEAQLLAVPEGKVTTAASPIDNPDAAYLAATTKIDITDLPFASSHESITDGTLTVTFSEPVVKLGPVPEGWSTWSAPPFSEDPNPFVLSSPTNILTLDPARPVSIFGFELEPAPFGEFDFTADFYLGDTLVESINRVVDGEAGARLFARENGLIDQVVVFGGAEFAIAQVRYQLQVEPINEVVFILLVVIILAVLVLLIL